MLRRRERLLPAAAFLALAATGVLVLYLVTSAVDQGREALEESAVAEAEAIARAHDERLSSSLASIEDIVGSLQLDLEVGSEADAREFQKLLPLLEEAGIRTGFYVTDAEGVLTQGVRLREAEPGVPVDRPGFDAVVEEVRTELEQPSEDGATVGAFAPVGTGLTIDLPTYAVVLPLEREEGGLRGTFVFESEVAIDSRLNAEVGQLGRGETGEVHVYDQLGTVVASTDPSLVARPLPDAGLIGLEPGLHRRGGEVQVLADFPNAGWNIALVQDASEFDEGLAGPLQRVGLIVVVVFLAVGVASFIALSRRLRAAREEEQRLRRLNETQDEFISIVSHELRTPVAGVLGFLQTTLDHWESMTDTERFNAVRRSASNARRLQGLTRDVLDSQSVDSGRMGFSMADTDLREEVVVAVEAARALYPRLEVEAVLDADAAPVTADVDRIQQVLTNLVDNAAKASPPDGTVTVRLWREGERVHVSVADQGPGLAPEMRERAFEKFARGRESGVSGTGLGLYISRQILEAHGGTIRIDDPPEGGGAVFCFDLPLAGAPVAG